MELWTSICKKCKYGEDVRLLNAVERILYITITTEMEVNVGGFRHLFINSTGEFVNEIVSAFKEIGAIYTASICENALATLSVLDIPWDSTKLKDLCVELSTEQYTNKIKQCDDEFIKYPEDLVALNYEYAMEHRDEILVV